MQKTILPPSSTNLEKGFDLSVARLLAQMAKQLPTLPNQPDNKEI